MLWYKRSIGEWVNGELVLQPKKKYHPYSCADAGIFTPPKKDYAVKAYKCIFRPKNGFE